MSATHPTYAERLGQIIYAAEIADVTGDDAYPSYPLIPWDELGIGGQRGYIAGGTAVAAEVLRDLLPDGSCPCDYCRALRNRITVYADEHGIDLETQP